MSIEFSDVTQVFETEHVSKANKYLDLGWILLNTYTTGYDTHPPFCYYQSLHYVLGWCASNGEIKIPIEPKSMYGTII